LLLFVTTSFGRSFDHSQVELNKYTKENCAIESIVFGCCLAVEWTARDKESSVETKLIIEYSKLIVVWGIIALDRLTKKNAEKRC